jgi:N-dimethylarginine dimethylaminohydrolase
MNVPHVISTVDQWRPNWALPPASGTRIPRHKALFVHPRCFKIENPINVHMMDEFGVPHKVSTAVAEDQWQRLVEVYQRLGFDCHVINVDSQLPDMVFCANQTYPYLAPNGTRHVLLSEMRSTFRKLEVPYFATFFSELGYTIHHPPPGSGFCLEGMGDLLPLSQGQAILAGHGPRTDREALDWVSHETGWPVVALELPNPKFYHLDTCLSILGPGKAAAVQPGFTSAGWNLLQTIFPTLITIPPSEADAPGFAGNCHCPDGQNIVIQKGNPITSEALREAGFTVHEVDTSEFIKAGGSVFCLKMMFF